MSALPGQFQLRDTIKDLCPPWLRNPNGEKFIYTIGLALDLLAEKQNQAQKAHMPGLGDPTQIPLLAHDRMLVQGPNEPDAQFSVRLSGAFQAWGLAGSRAAVLQQIQAYLTDVQPGVVGMVPECTIVGGNTSLSTWDTIYQNFEQGDPPSHILKTPANWNWDGQQIPWRAWLVLYMTSVPTGQAGTTASVTSTGGSGVSGVTSGFATITGLTGISTSNVQNYLILTNAATGANNGKFQIVATPTPGSVVIANQSAVAGDANNGSIHWSIENYEFIGPGPVYGSQSFTWGPNRSWGLNCNPKTIVSIRNIVKAWKSAQTFYPNIIIAFDVTGAPGAAFSPFSGQGSGNPDGTFGSLAKTVNGVAVPARVAGSPYNAYCDGTGRYGSFGNVETFLDGSVASCSVYIET